MRQTKLTHEKHTALTIKVATHLNYFWLQSLSVRMLLPNSIRFATENYNNPIII